MRVSPAQASTHPPSGGLPTGTAGACQHAHGWDDRLRTAAKPCLCMTRVILLLGAIALKSDGGTKHHESTRACFKTIPVKDASLTSHGSRRIIAPWEAGATSTTEDLSPGRSPNTLAK